MCDPRIYCRDCDRCTSTLLDQSPNGTDTTTTNTSTTPPSIPPNPNATHLCSRLAFLGLAGNCGGGFSERVAVDARLCHVLPQDTPSRDCVALIEPLAVAHHAVKQSGVDFGVNGAGEKPKTILILGAGPIGIAIIYDLLAAARADGGGKSSLQIIISEPTAARRAMAEQFADEGVVVVDPTTTTDLGGKCRDLTRGIGVDVVFDCAGVQRAADAGFDALRARGTYTNVAVWEGPVRFFQHAPRVLSLTCLVRPPLPHLHTQRNHTAFQHGLQRSRLRRRHRQLRTRRVPGCGAHGDGKDSVGGPEGKGVRGVGEIQGEAWEDPV